LSPEQRVLAGESVGLLMDPRTRLAEARRLGRTRTREAVPLLRKFTDDRDPEVRLACVWALGEIGDKEAVQAARVRAFDKDVRVRIEAAKALGKLYNASADRGLKDLLADGDPRVRSAAAEALGGVVHEERAATTLLQALDHKDAGVRRLAIEALARTSGEPAVRGMAKALADADPSVRSIAAGAFDRMKEQILPRLREALTSARNLEARVDAARMLARMGGVEAAPTLIRLLDNIPKKRGREIGALPSAVAEALVAMGEAALAPLKQEAIDGECSALAEEAAAEVCIRIGKAAVTPIAESILKWKLFPDPNELKLWVKTLGEIGDPRAAEALNRALAQDIEGMEGLVAGARRKIEAKSGVTLPALTPDLGLLRGQAGAEALKRIRRGEIVLTPTSPEAEGLPDDGVVRLCLRNALIRPDGRRDLEIELLRRDGKWVEWLWGYSLRFNKRSHEGRLVKHREGDKIVLSVEMVVHTDYWVRGGFGEYEIALELAGSRIAGAYRGQFNHREVAGKVTGVCWQRPWRKTTGLPLASGEHPRLLFRRHHLRVLRERARTDFGRHILRALRARLAARKTLYRERVNWVTTWEPGMDLAIGHGFLAALFEDAPHGRRAAALMMERTRVPPYGGEHGERFPGPVFLFPFAYDLGYEYLEGHEREKIAGLLGSFYDHFTVEWGPKGIFAVSRGVFPVPGMMGLVVLRDKGPFSLKRPQAPRPVVTISPEKTLGPHEGVPVNQFEAGGMIRRWLMNGPFDVSAKDDPLASLGGCASAQPQRGTGVPYRGTIFRFVPLPKETIGQITAGNWKAEYITIPAAEPHSRSFLYSLLEAKREVGCLVHSAHPLGARWSQVWINGRKLENGTVIVLKPGLHRVMVEVRGAMASPSFPPVDAYAVEAEHKKHQWLVEQWRAAKRRHEQTGELQEVPLILGMCRRGVRTCCWYEIERARRTGEGRAGGWILPFLSACWTATGKGLLPDTPLLLAAHPQLISSSRMDNRYLCFAMGIAPERLRPALVWEFNRRFLPDKLHRLSCLDLVAAFVNYPLDVTPRHPDEIVPKGAPPDQPGHRFP